MISPPDPTPAAPTPAAPTPAAPTPAAEMPVREAPLSFGQQRLWLLAQLGRDLVPYNVPQNLWLVGGLDTAALELAFTRLVRRHEALRTAVVARGDRPVQRISPARAVKLPLHQAADEAAAVALAGQFAQVPFDLERGPLFRIALVRVGPEHHLLSVTLSHLICDGWSLGVFWRDLADAYGAVLDGDTPRKSPPLPVQLADYAVWQRRRYTPRRAALIDYWRAQLELAPTLDLPTDWPRAPVARHRGAILGFAIAPDLTDQLRGLAQREGASLYMVLLTAFKVMLARHSGQDDVVLGSPTAQERGRPELRPIIGMVANMLVLRTDLGDAPGFATALRRVRDRVLGACQHAEFPFEQLVAELRVTREPGRNPLFDVVFVLDEPGAPIDFSGLRAEPLPLIAEQNRPAIDHVTAKFDLTVAMAEHDGGLRGVLEYDADLFDAERVLRLTRHFTQLLRAAVHDPDGNVWQLPMLDASELQKLEAAQRPRRPRADAALLPSRVASHAAATPRALAVSGAGVALDYASLEVRSNRLAHHLQQLGLGRGELIAVLMQRRPAFVVAQLAVWKVGAAFAPLDPEQPTKRTRAMIDAAGAAALLVDSVLLDDEIASAHVQQVVQVDQDEAAWANAPIDAPPVAASPSDLAYVMHTSGSTGCPKGVEVEHSALVELVAWHVQEYAVTPTDRGACVSGLGFDAAVWEVWPYLATGASVHLPDDQVRRAPDALLAWLAAEQVDLCFAPTPLVEAMLLERLPDDLCLRALLTGGDRLSTRPPTGLPFPVINHYGPTECTVVATCGAVSPVGTNRPPIGRPLEHVEAVVLGPRGELAPVGVTGELWLGGPALARGYRSDPAQTAARFATPAWAGRRMFRTGDLVRWRPDGQLDFIGRADAQVQVRGVRVEPAEVEQVLLEHPAIAAVAVVARPAASGELELVAVAVPAGVAGDRDADAVGAFAAERLPPAMQPRRLVWRTELPRNANGKVDRDHLIRMALPASGPRTGEPPRGPVEARVAALWRDVLGIADVGRADTVFELGGHSMHLVQLRRRLEQEFSTEVSVAELFRHPTVAAMATSLQAADAQAAAPAPALAPARDGAIAIIGMAGKFPKAPDLEVFWENLVAGREAITFFSPEQIRAARGAAAVEDRLNDPSYVWARAVLEDIDRFDAALFKISPREAERMDPQVRLFLEVAWEALESAGYDPLRAPGAVGVFAGCGVNSYERHNLARNAAFVRRTEGFEASLSDLQFLTLRVSHKLDLTGPSVQVDTASSTGLVAVVQACQALQAGNCDMALAGGAHLAVPQVVGHPYREGEIHSPDGHCRPFDAAAQGTVSGEGVGAVLLKPLEAARRDGDVIRAIIRGAAINNDGAKKVGFTAPSVDGQAAVITTAQRDGAVEPDTIGYVECHGTATPLGDPVEVAALTQAFRQGTDRVGFCAIGSLKSNLGHLDSAAGIAGLIKAALALEREAIPPSLHYEEPNPEIDFARSPFYVNARLRPWPRGPRPRRAGVSSFGVGGTNAHVVLEEAEAVAPAPPRRREQLLVLSARSPTALQADAARLAAHLRRHPDQSLADVTWTTQVGRTPMPHRWAAVVRDHRSTVEALQEARAATGPAIRRSVVFLFPGQGSLDRGVGRSLYRDWPVFRDAVDVCCEHLISTVGVDLRSLLFGGEVDQGRWDLTSTRLAQPAVFVMSHALSELWRAIGVRPVALLGHSVGELAAACQAGVFRLEDALDLVAARGRLLQELPPGAMLSVALGEDETRERLEPSLSLAAVNAPASCVVAGPPDAVAALSARLRADDVACRRLPTSHAFHSWMMGPAAAAWTEMVRQTERAPASLLCASSLTGDWMEPDDWCDPDYWGRALCEPVRFAAAVQRVLADEARALLEVGPGQTLTALAKQQGSRCRGRVVVSSMPHREDQSAGSASLLGAVGRLWCEGTEIDWNALAGSGRRRVRLPTSPFERQRYWVEPDLAPAEPTERRDLDRWIRVPVWRKAPRSPSTAEPAPRRWLCCVTPGEPHGAAVVAALRPHADVVVVRRGATFSRDQNGYTVRPGVNEDFDKLIDALFAADQWPDAVAYLWALECEPTAARDCCFYGIQGLAQSLHERRPDVGVRLEFVSEDLFAVRGGEGKAPERAMLLGAVRVLPVELAGWRCRLTDLPGDDPRSTDALLDEWRAPPGDWPVVAYRGGRRWRPELVPDRRLAAVEPTLWQRPGGAFLITGGVGGVGLALAERLAQVPGTRLALLSRQPLPPRSTWADWLARHGDDHPTSARLSRLQRLEASGAELLLEAADVGDMAAMREVLERVRRRFGSLRAVIHAAGVAAGGLAVTRDRARTEAVLGPKVDGTAVLRALLADEPLECLVLCSSLITWMARPGTIDYVAANAVLDAHAQGAHEAPWPVVAMGWDAWRSSGMGLAALRGAAGLREAWGDRVGAGLSDDEGWRALVRLAPAGEPHVLVATRELESAAPPPPRVLVPPTESALASASDDAATSIAAVVEDLLGVAVGPNDDFFEIGFDSLIGHRLVAKLRQRRGWRLTLRQVLETPNVASLAAVAQPVTEPEPAPSAPTTRRGERAASHPWLGEPQRVGSTLRWRMSLSPARHWVLDEHRLDGRPVLVGTAYLELGRAAFVQAKLGGGGEAVELRDVHLLQPLSVDDGAEREVVLELTPTDNRSADLRVHSAGPDGTEIEHATGHITSLEAGAGPVRDLAAYQEGESHDAAIGVAWRHRGLAFGSRWQGDRRVWRGRAIGAPRLTAVELPQHLAAEDRALVLHPALLDAAVADLDEAAAGMLPFSYDRVLVRGSMPLRCEALTERRDDAGPDELRYDVTVCAAGGGEVVRIEGFTLRRARPAAPAPANAALVVPTPGDLGALRFAPAPRLLPGADEVEIEVAYTGVNFKDVMYALGLLRAGSDDDLGMECAGTVTRVGRSVRDLRPGQSVIALVRAAYRSFVTVSARAVAPIPAGMGLRDAATVPSAYLTAYHALITQGRLQRGERVLVHAAAGGVGLAAVRVAHWRGAQVWATAGSDEKRAFLRGLGIEHVMDSRTLDFAGAVLASTEGEGVDVVLNSLSGAYVAKGMAVLRPFGRFLELGMRDIAADTPLGMSAFAGSRTFTAVLAGLHAPTFDLEWRAVLQAVAQGVLPPLPNRVFPAAEIGNAFEHVARAAHIGKVLIEAP
ncbi:MAG: amino acid adenylation domain-containing protein [Planctomycetota bacterium]